MQTKAETVLFKNQYTIFFFSFILFSIGSFGISFFPPDEPKYVDAALRMIETGNYIVPFFNCHIRFDKPILYYWELVASFKLFGIEHLIKTGYDPLGIIEYSARLPSIIAGSFSAVFVYLLSLDLLRDKKIAINSVIAFFSMLFFFYLSRAVYPDMSLILFELIATYYFIKNRYIAAWIFVGLAFLVKGPIGVVTPGFTYFIYLWTVKKSSGLKEFFSIRNGLGFLVFLAISLPWYIAIYKIDGMEFINKFFIYHNIERFTGAAHQHPHSFFYYFPVVAAIIFFWLGYLKDLLPKINLKDKNNLFLILWFLWIFLFFSISQNKLVHYIAAAFIPISILFARYVNNIENTKFSKIFMAAVETVLALSASFYLFIQSMYEIIPAAFLGITAMAVINFSKSKPIDIIFKKTIIFSITLFIVLLQFESYRPEKKLWRTMISNPYPLYEYKINNRSLVAYSRKCINETGNRNFFKTINGKFYVYTKMEYLSGFKHYKIIFTAVDKGKKSSLILIDNKDD
jgi:4-amino-4-deoxy-L-arabinose transferase-like glycosyltransferase